MGGGTTARAAEPLLAPVEAGGRRKPRLAYLRCTLTARGRSHCSAPSTDHEVTARRVAGGGVAYETGRPQEGLAGAKSGRHRRFRGYCARQSLEWEEVM